MSNSPYRPGLANCHTCRGEGFVVEARGATAWAEPCSCIAPCDLCGGTGRRVFPVEGQVRVGRCRCQKLPDRLALFNRAGLPSRHAQSTLEGYNRKAQAANLNWKQARMWLDGFRPGEENRGLVLHGAPGRGKTHLLVGLLRELIIQHGIEARFVEFSHLLSELKAGFDGGLGESTTLVPLVRVPVLAIDELGKGRGTEWELTIIDALVSHRYNALATTLASTNFMPGGATGLVEVNLTTVSGREPGTEPRGPTLGDRVGDRVYSRLKEMCLFAAIKGDDYRQRPG